MNFYNRSATIYKSNPAPSLRNRRSMTLCSIQVPSRKKETKTLEDIEQEIIKNHQTINGIIVRFKQVVSQRLQAQQLQLLLVFKNTVDKMMTQIGQIVTQYRQALDEVKLDPAINKLENELSYFKKEALQLFDINQSYKKQISELKRTICDMKIDSETNQKALQKLTKRVLKSRNKRTSLLTQNSEQTQHPFTFITHNTSIRPGMSRSGHRKTITSSLGKLP